MFWMTHLGVDQPPIPQLARPDSHYPSRSREMLEEVQRIEVRHTTGPDRDPDDDALRILTVHGAKGLEFPIVLLTGLGAKRQWRKPAVVVDRRGRRVEVRSGDFQTAGYAALESIEERIDQAERVRLLYVAATRARALSMCPGTLPRASSVRR